MGFNVSTTEVIDVNRNIVNAGYIQQTGGQPFWLNPKAITTNFDIPSTHIARLVNETSDDYMSKVILNGVYLNEEGYETWEVIKNPYKENLSRFISFIWHDPITGLNNRTTSATAAIAYYDMVHDKYTSLLQQFRDSCKIQQQYMDEARKYTIWVTVE